jgi:hypothetical protein
MTLSNKEEGGDSFSYAEYCAKCGNISGAAVDYPIRKSEVAKFVARAIRDGFKVERIESSKVRASAWCACNRPQPSLFDAEPPTALKAVGDKK